MTSNDMPTLKPCPFCGGNETETILNGQIWRGTLGYGPPVSVSIIHHCPKIDGQPSRRLERVGRDEESAIRSWNTRVDKHDTAGNDKQEALAALEYARPRLKQSHYKIIKAALSTRSVETTAPVVFQCHLKAAQKLITDHTALLKEARDALAFYGNMENYMAEMFKDKPGFDFKRTPVHNDGGDIAREMRDKLSAAIDRPLAVATSEQTAITSDRAKEMK